MTISGRRHSEETKKLISESKRTAKNRPPLVPQLCGCGCGEFAAVDERRNRVSKFVAGHNSKIDHPMQGRHHSDETRARLATYKGPSASHYKHGWTKTPTHVSWKAMMGRCYSVGNASYPNYGARGIAVCERWHDFLNFLEDMGARPSLDYELDREDPDGNYDKANCRWITRAENQARKRSAWPARRAKSVERIERVLLAAQHDRELAEQEGNLHAKLSGA